MILVGTGEGSEGVGFEVCVCVSEEVGLGEEEPQNRCVMLYSLLLKESALPRWGSLLELGALPSPAHSPAH